MPDLMTPCAREALHLCDLLMDAWSLADEHSQYGKRLRSVLDRAWRRYERRLLRDAVEYLQSRR